MLLARHAVRIVTLLVLLALWPSVVTLVQFWLRIRDYRFGFAVAVACLVWLNVVAGRLGSLPAQSEPRILPMVLLAIAAWTIAFLGASDMVHQILLPVVLWLAIIACAGTAAGRVCIEPIGCLYLGMPLWDYLVPLLQRATVVVTESLLHLMGVPAAVMATTVRIPEGTFEVAEGCAGKKYFMVAIAFAVLAGAYCRLPLRGRLWLIGTSAALALVVNWLRVIIIVVAGHLTNMQHYLVAKEHLTFGTGLFVVLILVLACLVRTMSRRMSTPDAATIAPHTNSSAGRPSVAVAAASLLPLVIPLAVSAAGIPSATVKLGNLPLETGPCQGPLPPNSRWKPRYQGAADEMRASYVCPEGTVEIYLNVYGPQQDGKELINYDNSLLGPGAWTMQSAPSGQEPAKPLPSDFLPLQAQVGTSGVERWVVGYSYVTGGHVTHSDLGEQMLYGTFELLGSPASGVAAMAVRCLDDCEMAGRALQSFWTQRERAMLALIPDHYIKD